MIKTDELRKNRDQFIAMPGINRFFERLKVAMGGMSNVALANACDLSESAVRSYLKGRSYPSIDKIQAISQACNVPLVWLITGDEFDDKNDSIVLFGDEKLTGILEVMTKEQRHQLALAIVQYGISGIFSALNGIESVSAFAMLSDNERRQIMRLHESVKKGASKGGEVTDRNYPLDKDKQAI